MDNSINFKGVFVVNRPNVVLRQAIKAAGMLNSEQILPEYVSKNSVLYVVNDCFDKNVASILVGTPKAKFKYYPMINKSDVDTKNKPEVIDMLYKAKDSVIKSKEKLIDVFRQKSRDALLNNIRKIHDRNLELMHKETFIDFNDKSYKKTVDVKTGVCNVFTELPVKNGGKIKNIKHTLLEITPPDEYGYCYAAYTPAVSNDIARYIVINKNGEKIFEYKDPNSSILKSNVSKAKQCYIDKFHKGLFIS